MERRKGLFIVALPLLVGAALLFAVNSLRRSEEREISEPKAGGKAHSPVSTTPMPYIPTYTPQNPPKPAPPPLVVAAADEARMRGTYQNYRTAMATGNQALIDALEPVLKRNRDAATRLAEEEVSKAANPSDREIALKTLEALGR